MSRRTALAASAAFALAVGALVSWNVSRRARDVESDAAAATVPARRWASLRFPFLSTSGEGALSISGRITLDGAPADGVEITVLRRPAGALARCIDTFEPHTYQCRGGSWGELIWDVVESGRAAAVVSEGRFTGDFRISGLAPGAYSLWFEAPRGTAVVESVEAGTSGLDVRLRPPLAIRGKVMDDEGAAIAGAERTVLHSPTAHLTTTVAAADGTFAFPSLPSGGYFVTAAQTGLEPAMQWARLSVGSIEVELRLQHLCRVTGVVRRVSGPVAGCPVHVWTMRGERETVSGNDGTFALDEVPNQPSVVIAECQGERAQSVSYGCESPSDLTLWLQPVHWIRGRVLDESRRPVSDAWVRVWRHGGVRCGNEGPSAYTNAEGRFEVGPYDPQLLDLAVGADGMKSVERRILVDDGDLDLELTLTPATRNPALHGRVVDIRGNPAPGASISSWRGDEEEDFAKSNAQGEFALDWEKPGEVELKISSEVLLDTSEKIELPWTGIRTFTLEDGFELRGTALEADGSPARATVDVYASAGEHANRIARVETDDSGRFVAAGIPRGRYELSARLRNGRSTPEVTTDVPGEPVELRFPPEFWIRGRVVNLEGKPVDDALVAIVPERSAGEPFGVEDIHRTRKGGWFSSQVPNEPHIVFLTKLPNDLAAPAQTVHAVPNGPEVQFSVDVPRVIGRAVDDQHRPIDSVYVNGHGFESRAGRFALYVPRGMAKLEIRSNYGDVVVSRSIDHGGDTDIGDVVLGSGRPLEGIVRDAASGAPVSGAEISLRQRATSEEREGDLIWSGTSDRDGRFMAPSVPLAPLDIEVSRIRYAPVSMGVPRAGQVEIRLVPSTEPSIAE